MRIVKLTALCAALALGGSMLAGSTATAVASPQTLPSAATRNVSVDVDGDHLADQVTIEQNGPDTYVVNVVTAAGKDDVVQFTSTIEADWGVEPWIGAAKLDGTKGYELMVATSGGDGYFFRVLTWRSGALTWEKAPKSRMLGSYDWYVASLDFVRYGYRFTTANGHRYVRDFVLTPSGSHWKGTVVKSVWKSGAWKKVSTKKVNLTKNQAKAYNGITGATVIAKP
jgi:hypothetical protein